MPIALNSLLSSATANSTFLDKTIDDIKKGKLTLYKINIGDADTIDDVQQFILDIADTTGTFENDGNAKNYSSTNYIANGDSQKTCIEKEDAQIRVNRDDINSNDAELTAYGIRITDNENNISQNVIDIGTNDDDILAIQNSVGSANGIAPLNASTKIDGIYLPSYVDDVEEYADLASFPVTGEAGKIYVALDTNKTYRWSGSTYVEISPSDVNSVNGYTGVVNLVKSDIGLTNVTDDEQLKRSANDFNTFTEKESLVEDDIILLEDSEDGGNKKFAKLANLIGGGGSGGGSFVWDLNEDISPYEDSSYGIAVLDFDYESNMAISALAIIPSGYIDGKVIALENTAFVTSSSADNVLFKAETTLIRTGDDISNPVNVYTSLNDELSLSSANQVERVGPLQLTDLNGQINGIYPVPGDILKIKLSRDNAGETISSSEDASLLRYSSTISFDYDIPVIPPSGNLTWTDPTGTGTFDFTGSSYKKTDTALTAYVFIKADQEVTGGDFELILSAKNAGNQNIIGLDVAPYASGDNGDSYSFIDYGFSFTGLLFSTWEGSGSGQYNGTFTETDVFKIEVISGTVYYWQNTTLIRTAPVALSSYPVRLSGSVYGENSECFNMIFQNI